MSHLESGETSVQYQCSTTKPNIFLIGDSIRIGYCKTVKRIMADTAEVFFPDDNCRSSQFAICSMKQWAGALSDPAAVDLVQFNCGHWDTAHWDRSDEPLTSAAEYEKNIGMILRSLRIYFPNARIVFATTTPVNPNEELAKNRNPRDNETIDRYNAIAVRIAKENGIAVNDLNAFTRTWDSDCFKDHCHFVPDACERLGEEVARRLTELLPKREG